MAADTSATPILCDPVQSKCTWTFRKNHFVWKFTGKMPDANPTEPVSCGPAQSKRTWTFDKSHCMEIYMDWPDTDDNHFD